MSQIIAEQFRQMWETEYNQTQAVLAVIPDDQMAFVPFPGAMSLRQLALHVIGLEEQFIRGVQTGEAIAGSSRRDISAVQTAAALAAHYETQHAALRPVVQELTDEFIARPVTFKLPTGQILFTAPGTEFLFSKMLHHMIHHRAQLLTFLRLLGVQIPGLYGPTRENTPAGI